MATLECTYEEFKRASKQIMVEAPSLSIDQLNNAWKCFGLMFLGIIPDANRAIANIQRDVAAPCVLKITMRELIKLRPDWFAQA